jgi:H+/Cl- antiporter ClcA
MLRLRGFVYDALTLIWVLALVWHVMFALELLGHFFTGGFDGASDWIIHINTEGRLEFPSRASIFTRFAVTYAFLILVTVSAWWGRRFFDAERRGPSRQ